MWELCKIYQKTPDDPFFEEMDPVLKRWLFEQWLGDRKDNAELAKNHAYLIASFSHPEAVKQLIGQGNMHISTDEEFEESSKMVREMNLKALELEDKGAPRKRKRRTVKQG